MTWRIEKTYHFEAAHQLSAHDGKCADLHGHSYTVTVGLMSRVLQWDGPGRGMVVDFNKIDLVMKTLIDARLDHKFLNDSLGIYTTSENIAEWVYEALRESPLREYLEYIRISETEATSCTYQR